MNRKFWILGVVIGIVVGLTVTIVMTFLDWRLNPGGIFHGAHGTDWIVVTETALSWFVPMSVFVGVLALIVLFLYSRLR